MSPADRFELILGMMAAVLLLNVLAQRVRLPPSAVLVLGGIGLALAPGLPEIELDPELILLLFLPPLLFSSAYFTVWRDFRANLRIILQLAIGAVAFTTLVVGLVAHLVLPGLPWAACFALGAIVSPPDAVAAKAALKGLPLPPRLVTLLEGESLVNDATGLVLFRIAVTAGLTGTFNSWVALGSFAFLSAGGVIVGTVYGYALACILARARDPLLNIAGGLLGAWSAYMVGEALHVSGVLSTVSCGIVLGWRQHDVYVAAVRTQANVVWAMLVFLLESLIFILIGLSLRGVLARLDVAGVPLASLAGPIGIIAAAMILARFAWVMPATYLPRFLLPSLRRRDPYPLFAVPVVMSWAGMRGVVSLAVALSLPDRFPGRDVLLASTLALILISILLQGTTLAPLTRFLQLGGFRLETRDTLNEAETRVLLSRAALDTVRLRSHAPDGSERHPRLLEQYTHRAEMADLFVKSNGHLSGHRQEHFETVLAANKASRAALLSLHRSACIHDSVLQILEAELDLEELGARHAILSDDSKLISA